MRRTLTALLTVSALGLAACGDDEDDKAASTTKTTGTTATQAAAQTTPATTTTPTKPAQALKPKEGECLPVDAPKPKDDAERDAPDLKLTTSKVSDITFETNCGSFTVRLDVKDAPKTASSVAGLVKDGFYDGLTFHRIVPGFVIQGGDPSGNGSGGPGYSVTEAPPKDVKYTKGVVAMAKTQIEDPGTSGSQFYVVTGDDAGLPPEYALLGKVVRGLDVVDTIASVPTDPATEQPESPVVITKATLTSK